MQEAVKRFVKECHENSSKEGYKVKPHGLTLIDMPTGSGKTYNTIQLISKFLKGEVFQDQPKNFRIFYLTPLNKNVKDAYNDLRDSLRKEGREDLFNSNCLWLQANYQAVKDNFSNVEQLIPIDLKRKDSFQNLKKYINGIKNSTLVSDDYTSDSLAMLENEIREKFEPAFRSDLKTLLNNICPNTDAKRKKIHDDDWKWIQKLYPASLIEERKVIFMSVDKFFMLNDPIISRPYSFINSKLIEGSLVFIDEFDASKEYILRSQIQQSTQNKLDLVKYISTLSSSFASHNFSAELFPKPKDNNEKKSSRYAFNELKKVVEDCRKKCKLDYHFKLENSDKEKRCFIFQDKDLHMIYSTKDTPSFSLYNDENKGLNVIKIGKEKEGSKEFFKLIYTLTGALSFSKRAFSMMSRNYLNYYNYSKHQKDDDMMTPEESVSTTLNEFDLDSNISNVIQKLVTSEFRFALKNKPNKIIGGTFYTNGFRYFDFIDDLSHDTTTVISMCFLNNTPENYILSLASVAMVVGISATATIDTVTGNYNLKYLKMKLGNNFIPLSKEDSNRISEEFKKKYKEGREYKVNVVPLDSSHNENEDYAKDIFTNPDNIEDLSAQLDFFNSKAFDKQRYIRVLLAIKKFINDPNGKAMLVLTNYNMETFGTHPFNRDHMDTLVKEIKAENNIKKDVSIHVLHGNIYEFEKQQYQNDIKAGKKVVLFTSYPASGTGQNLQYSLMEGEDKKGDQKDIDSIYLERPTNAIVNINLSNADEETTLSEEDLIKYIYQIESLRYQGEIDKDTALARIKKAFKIKMKGELQSTKFRSNIEYETPSVNNHLVKILEQAVGRICRTRDKNKNDVNIYLDSSIFEKISFDSVKNKLMNKEFRAIVDMSTKVMPNDHLDESFNRAINKSEDLAKSLENLIEKNANSWPSEDQKDWKDIREWLLKHPTCSKQDLLEHNEFENLYFELPDDKEKQAILYFSSKNDLKNNTRISLTKKTYAEKEISEEECGLVKLIKIPAVQKYFREKGYAERFSPNEMMMLPSTYINLYKGALGEAVGEAIFKKEYGIELKEIEDPNKFEKFDFEVPNSDGIYIDFKLWSTDSEENGEKLLEKAQRKLESINGKKAFIVNIICSNDNLSIKDNGKICRVPNIVKHFGNCLYVDLKKKEEVLKKIINGVDYGTN